MNQEANHYAAMFGDNILMTVTGSDVKKVKMPIERYNHIIFMEGLRKITELSHQDIRPLVRENLVPLKLCCRILPDHMCT
jgi:hypothetical protein